MGKAERKSEMGAEFVLGNSLREEGKRSRICPALRARGREKKLRLSWVIASREKGISWTLAGATTPPYGRSHWGRVSPVDTGESL